MDVRSSAWSGGWRSAAACAPLERGAEDALRHVDDEEHQHQPVDGEVERRELLEGVAERKAQPSCRSSVITAPTVGPSMTNMPPAIAPKTICSEMPMPETVSG